MANQAIAPAAPPAATGKVAAPAAAPVKLPEAFRDQPDPGPAPEMDAFAELEAIDAKNPSPNSRPPKVKPEAEKPAPEKPAKSEPSATEKAPEKGQKPSQEKPKDEPKTDAPAADKSKPAESEPATGDDPSMKFQLASDLRRDYRRLHAENERLATELQQVKSRKPNESNEDRKVIDARLETLEKRNRELEEEISYRDYTKSTEFQEKFRKPFETKLARVYRQVADFSVRTEDGGERPATREDFDRVLEAGQSDARRIAKEIFGEEDFREVLQFRRELNELQQNADDEAKSWREKSKEREQSQISEQRKIRDQAEVAFKKSIDTYVEKYPELFGQVEGDEELNNALTKGFTEADKSQDRRLPLDQRVDLLAAGRLKQAVFGRNMIQIKRLKSRVAELEEALKAYEKSEPGEGQGQRGSTVAANGKSEDDLGDVNEEIEALERRNPVQR